MSGKKIFFVFLGVVVALGLLVTLVLLRSEVGLLGSPVEILTFPEAVTAELVAATRSNPRESHDLPLYGGAELALYLSGCSMRPLQNIRNRVYETGAVELELVFYSPEAGGPVTLLLGEKNLVSKDGVLYEIEDGERVKGEILDLYAREILLSFEAFTDIRVGHTWLYDDVAPAEGDFAAVIGRYRWSVADFYEQCANAPEATIVLTNADGLELWIQSDMDDLLVDDGSGACLWFESEARDGEILDALLPWAKAAENAEGGKNEF